MECAECGKKMVEKEEMLFGQEILVMFCPSCGRKVIVDTKEAEKFRKLVPA